MAKVKDDEYFTLVFKGDLRKLKHSPMNLKTRYGYPAAAGPGNAFEQADDLRDQLRDVWLGPHDHG